MIASAKLTSGPRGCVFGPFGIMLRSPELLTRAQLPGEYVRFHSAIPKKLREMSMLIVGKEWNQPYIWYIHEPIAIKAGLSRNIISEIAQGNKSLQMDNSESVVYDFSMQLLQKHRVDDITYNQIRTKFGEKGVVDLVAINGYFSMLCMMLNVANAPIPKGVIINFESKRSLSAESNE